MCSSENVCVWVCACGGAISPHTICVTVGEANLLVTGFDRMRVLACMHMGV